MLMYAPPEEQPKQSLNREEMTEVGARREHTHGMRGGGAALRADLLLSQREQIIFDHFTDPLFINQFVEFLSLEDRKGKDKFSPRRFCLFKVRVRPSHELDRRDPPGRAIHRCNSLRQGLFRNFNDAFLPLLRPHMERLVADSHESKQRCVAEIISGLIRGSKHWSFSKVRRLENRLNLSDLLVLSLNVVPPPAAGREPVAASVSSAPHRPVQHHHRDLRRLGHLHCHGLCKLFASFFSPFQVFSLMTLNISPSPPLRCAGEQGPAQAALAV